ncbi:DUF1317 family protein [Enterobacter hormaechei]|nr:DUF1317 family protein [Enterobacter hormaechei]MCM7652626.1 DUF1317 domain-containing protein [Enterobacter hormaechei]
MTHAHDDIRVGTLCLPFIGNGWLMPWGKLASWSSSYTQAGLIAASELNREG